MKEAETASKYHQPAHKTTHTHTHLTHCRKAKGRKHKSHLNDGNSHFIHDIRRDCVLNSPLIQRSSEQCRIPFLQRGKKCIPSGEQCHRYGSIRIHTKMHLAGVTSVLCVEQTRTSFAMNLANITIKAARLFQLTECLLSLVKRKSDRCRQTRQPVPFSPSSRQGRQTRGLLLSSSSF